jgi:predicted ABC-class ATPase
METSVLEMLRRRCSILPTLLLRRGTIQFPTIFPPRRFFGKGKRSRQRGWHKHPRNEDGTIAVPPPKKKMPHLGKNPGFTELRQLLRHTLNGQPYGGYRALESMAWRHSTHLFTLQVGTVQADPHAPPTRCRLFIPAARSQFPESLASSRIRRMAAADYLWRHAFRYCQSSGKVVTQAMQQEADRTVNSWSGVKGGEVQIMAPTQYVMEQSAVQMDADGNITCHVTVHLPARGRTILGTEAYVIFDTVLLYLVQRCFIAAALPMDEMKEYVDGIHDQAWLQEQLEGAGLVAFVRDGAMLPRRSGASDRPLRSETIVPFQSPPALQVSFALPQTGRTITGLGIRKGITLICGGGYHGKSTLLEAIQTGVYLKVPGDGRDFCVTGKSAVKIRAEDGRWVAAVDISSFVRNIPLGKDTACFSTADASGSTSQASNIVEVRVCMLYTVRVAVLYACKSNFQRVTSAFYRPEYSGIHFFFANVFSPANLQMELNYISIGISHLFSPPGQAIELGANTLLIDEDTCATNFMIRDAKMMQLVACEKEPITPFVRVVSSLKEQGISTILVVGGTGDFFSVADHVLVMDHYRCEDATARAHSIVQQSREKITAPPAHFGPIRPRGILSSQLTVNEKVKVLARNIILYGSTEIDLSLTEQIVSSFQANAIAYALQHLSQSSDLATSMSARLDALEKRLDHGPLDEVLAPGKFHGELMRPRKLEVGAAINRLRRNHCIEPMKKSVAVETDEVAKGKA